MFRWINAIFNVRKVLTAEKSNASFLSAIGNLFTGSVASAILLIFFELLFHPVEDFLITFFNIYPGREGAEFLLTFIVYPLILILFIMVISLSSEFIYFLFAKLFRGIGSFKEQLYLASLVMPQIIIGLNIILWLMIFSIHVQFLVVFALIILIILFIYTAYSFYLVFKEVHNFSIIKYIAVIIAPNLLFLLLILFI